MKIYKDVLLEWWDDYKMTLRPSTAHTKEVYIKAHIVPELGEVGVKKITPEILKEFVKKLVKKRLASSTIEKIFSIVKAALSWMAEKGYIKTNPAQEVVLPKVEPTEVEAFSIDEVFSILEAASPKWFRNAIEISFRTGMRRGEIFGLKWADIDFENRLLQIKRTVSATKVNERLVGPPKTNSSIRAVMLDDELLWLLKGLKEIAQSEWVIENSRGVPPSPWRVPEYMKAACIKAGVKPRKFHALRHTHATIGLTAGVNPKIIQERLGHSKVGTTLGVYSHCIPSMQGQVVAAFNKIKKDNDSDE